MKQKKNPKEEIKQFLVKHKISKFVNFPAFIFCGLILIAIVSIFGSHWAGSSSDTASTSYDCSKTGAMGGNVPWSSDDARTVYTKMNTLGLHWYMGLIDSPGDKQRVIDAANTANKMGINFMLRICFKGSCNFNNGEEYANFLNDVADNVNGEFWAIAGHNEPNGKDEFRPISEEKPFMDAVVSGVNRSNVHLLSPSMDLHAGPGDECPHCINAANYLSALNIGSVEGIAVNVYEKDYPGQLSEEIGKLTDYSAIYITETGPWEGNNFESFKNGYQQTLNNSNVRAALFFKPTGLYDTNNPEHITTEGTHEVIPQCGRNVSSQSLIVECPFEEEIMGPCEGGDIGLARGLKLEHNGSFSNPSWEAEWVASTQIKKLPAFGYYASENYGGLGEADFPSQVVNLNRLSPGCETDPWSGDKICYDSTIDAQGYGVMKAEGGVLARPEYHKGSGVLTSYLGDYSDYTSSKRIARQLIVGEDQIATITEADLTTTDTSKGTLLVNLWSKLTDWFSSLFKKEKHCEGSDFELDGLWDDDATATSGYETLLGEGRYTYNLDEFIDKSSLANTLKGRSCDDEYGKCKILSGVTKDEKGNGIGKTCNPCHTIMEPIDPLNPSLGYKPTDEKTCERIDWKTGEVYDSTKEDLINCINSQNPIVQHSLQPMQFELGGAAEILKTYWKKIQMLQSEKPVCHIKNIGIEVDVEGTLYDKKVECAGGGVGDCGENNLIINPTFDRGVRNLADKGYTIATVANGWYPWFDPDGCKTSDGDIHPPEFKGDTNQVLFTTSAFIDGGIIQPIKLNQALNEVGATIKVSGRYRPSISDDRADLLKLSAGLESGNYVDTLEGNGYQMSASSVSWKGPVTNSGNEEWHDFSFTFNSSDIEFSDTFTVFLRVHQNDYAFPNNHISIDDLCLTITSPSGTVYENTIEVELTGSAGSASSTYCLADSQFPYACSKPNTKEHEQANPTTKAYFPYFGTIIKGFGYLDLQSVATEVDVTDILPCEEASDDTVLCYCDEDNEDEAKRVDQLGEYLYSIGILNDEEIQLTGYSTLTKKITSEKQNNPVEIEGCPTWTNEPYDGYPGTPGPWNNTCRTSLSSYYPNVPSNIINWYGPSVKHSCDSGENMNRMFGTGNDDDVTDLATLQSNVCPVIESSLVDVEIMGLERKVHEKAKGAFTAVDKEIKSKAKSWEKVDDGVIFTFERDSGDIEYKVRKSDTGTYSCRGNVNQTGFSPSPHAFGIAIDMNWTTNPNRGGCSTDIPYEIVQAFVNNGFRWGGWWDDTMHFEYMATCIEDCHPYFSK